MFKKSFAPVADSEARILVLGSLPGDASLSRQEYYAYRHNVFWRIMGAILGFDADISYNERLRRLRMGGVALWDVVGQGERPGSLDSNISNVVPNDICGLLEKCPQIGCICCNGGTSFLLLKRHFPDLFNDPLLKIFRMPSTSPAAARIGYEGKLAFYREVILPMLEGEGV